MVLAWDNLGQAPAGWGSHVIVTWDQFEPLKGRYGFELFERALLKSPRPCYLQLAFSMFDKTTGAPKDYTPKHHKRSLKLTVNGRTGEIPPYDDVWTEAWCRAQDGLFAHFREHPQVLGFWLAGGIDQETQPVADNSAGNWTGAVRNVLDENRFYRFVSISAQRGVQVGAPKPVYLPGAPSPGTTWGKKRRDLIVDALRAGAGAPGAGYMNCGLQTDNDTSFGIGEHAGRLMYDIATLTPRRIFEEGRRFAKNEPLELYWLLLRALHWQADAVNLYGSISAPQYEAVRELLPQEGWRWLVFRGQEFKGQSFQSGGKWYGQMGEPGFWGEGLELAGDAVTLLFQPTCFGFERWTGCASAPLHLVGAGLADGLHQVVTWDEHGARRAGVAAVAGGRLTLPAGRYHRVDVREECEAEPMPVTLEERVTALERRVAALEARS